MEKNKTNTPKHANGVMPITLGRKLAGLSFDIIGGPFDNYPKVKEATFGVCVREERVPATGVNVHLPIRDFSIPTDTLAVEEALITTLKAAMNGDAVYVGCMGGWGRTGLFMALMAKVAGEKSPVNYVRYTYTPHAVETEPQQQYVADFDVTRVQRALFWPAWKAKLRRLFKR